MSRLPPKACVNCNKTFWPKSQHDLRCKGCHNALKGKRARVMRKVKPEKKPKYNPERDRLPDKVWPDGTKVWFYGPHHARTVGREYRRAE